MAHSLDTSATESSMKIPPQYATCSLCLEVNESNRDTEEDDLLVCIKSECSKKHRVMCRGCMRSSHKKKPNHKLKQDPAQFVHLQKWYDMTKIQKVGPNGTIETVVKQVGWGGMSAVGGVCGYAMADKAVLELVKQMPKQCTQKQLKTYAQGIMKGVYKSKESKAAVLKGMVQSQAAINGIMFAIEVGWNLVQYAYDSNITYNEMMRRNKKAGVAHGSAWIGCVIGGGIGLLFGPWGAIAGSALGGAIGDLSARQCFDSVSPNERRKHVEISLVRFGYGKPNVKDLLADTQKFNLIELKRRYKLYAFENHPDGRLKRAGRSEEEKRRIWDEFYSCYGVLLVLCRERDDKAGKKAK